MLGHRRIGLLVIGLLLCGLAFGGGVQADEDILELPGQIAYIGTDHNVYTLAMHDEQTAVAVTDDATNRSRYQWPTWASNGKLAYFCCDSNFSGQPGVEVFVSPDGEAAGELVYENSRQVFQYAGWSPEDCDTGEGCRDLAVLLTDFRIGEFVVEVIRSHAAEPETQQIGQGAPFYYSWSPTGDGLLLQRNNSRLDVFSLEDDEINELSQRPGPFQAPAWSPIDDRLLVGAINEDNLMDLVTVREGEAEVLVSGLQRPVGFGWSPDAQWIAYRIIDEEGFGDLIVIDAVTGKEMAQTTDGGIIAFFWSPDSTKLAYLTLAETPGAFNIAYSAQPEEIRLAWSVLDVEDGTNIRLADFVPTSEMLYLVTYFDQFAQSHQIWSPDSTHIVFSERTDNAANINILDMTRSGTVPFAVAEGSIGVWSYR
jgi:TolB protein